MSKKLVAYFSASGVTKAAAERLAKVTGADLFEIKPKTPYTRADLDWTDKKSRSSVESNNSNARPDIAEKLSNLDKYDTIFLGFPIWWYVAPKIINSFLESYDFSGKTIIPFATSGGSSMGSTNKYLASSCPNANLVDGKILNRIKTESELKKWADSYIK